jgi:hypothetical protein
MELANAFEPIQDDRIYIEKINGSSLYGLKSTPAEYTAGSISRSARLDESGIHIRLPERGGAPVHLKKSPSRLWERERGQYASNSGSLIVTRVFSGYARAQCMSVHK